MRGVEVNGFFSKTFYNNSISEWLISFAVIILTVLIAKIVYRLFSTIVRKFTNKSKNRLDDIIIDMIEEPLVFAIICGGIWLGLRMLTFPPGFDAFIGHAFQFLIIICVGWLAARLFDALLEEYIVPLSKSSDSGLAEQLLPILRKSIKTTIWALAIIIGLNNAGYNVGAVLAGLGIGGLALAMAAKDTVANVFGGFTIFTDQPFRINERVKVSGYDGNVREIGIRSTRLETLEGRLVTIPNSKFASSAVENVSREPSRKVIVDLGMTYDTTPDQMEQAMTFLRDIVDKNENTEEERTVFFNTFGDFAMNVRTIYYIVKGRNIADTQTQINMAILRTFNENNLEFAFPTQTLYNIDVENVS